MSDYKTFAIWGAGNLGTSIANHLLAFKATVIILTRPGSSASPGNLELAFKGAEVRAYDVSSDNAVSGLHGVDVLISTTGMYGLALQSKLVDAAHAAGVQLFLPAEFGETTAGREEPMFRMKQDVRARAEKLGLPTATVFSGLWPEFFVYMGFDFAAGKITIPGQGDGRISTTGIEDVAYFVSYVLVHLPRSKLENATFSLQGDVITFNSLAASIQDISSKPIEITHLPRAMLEEKVQASPNDALTAMWLGWDLGKGLHPNEPSNALVPGWQPKTALDILKPLIV